MNFVSPERLIWLWAALPVVLFYVLRTRLRRRPVATLMFWDRLFDEKRQRSFWQRLRHLLSLLLQLAFLLLVVAALVDPLWQGQQEDARQVVIVLDNSASMNAVDDAGESRLERARQEALGVVSALRSGDEAALVTAGSTVRIAVGMTDFGPAVRDAIQAIEPTDGPTRVSEAIEAARRLTRAPQRRELVIISDFCFEDAKPLAEQDDVRPIAVGEPVDNAGITSLAARRSLVDPIGYAALVEVHNFGDSSFEGRLTVELAEELVDVIPLSLSPGEAWQKTIVGASAAGGVLRASLDAEDALPADNTARAVIPAQPAIPVVLVSTQPSLYLESVFESIPLIELSTTSTPPAQAPEGGFVVLHRVVPEELPRGSVLVIDPRSGSEAWTLGRTVDQAIVAEQDTSSPLMPHVRLTNVLLPGARDLQLTEPARALLNGADGSTWMASRVDGDDRLVALSVNLEEGDLPLRIAFPVMMTNAVNWFLGRTGELQPALQTGQLAEVPLGTSPAEPWAWRDSAGETGSATIAGEAALVGPIDRVGSARLGPRRLIAGEPPASPVEDEKAANRPREQLRTLAVNLCDRAESDLNPRLQPLGDDRQIASTGQHSLWFYLACLALGLVVGEWFLYQRRIVG